MKNTKPNFNKIDRLINEKLKFIYKDEKLKFNVKHYSNICLLYTSPSPRDLSTSRMPSSA